MGGGRFVSYEGSLVGGGGLGVGGGDDCCVGVK